MAKFNGKNSITSPRILASDRAKYSTEALPEKKQIKSLTFAENVLYGRVDTNMNPITPNKDSLKTIGSRGSQTPLTLVNFVADAFLNLSDIFQSAANVGTIDQKDPYLTVLQPARGWTDPQTMYEEYIDDMLSSFNQIFITEKREQLINSELYIEEFLVFVKKMSPRFPITYTAWQRSRNSSLFTSGLAIDLAGLPIDNDTLKENFINSRNFDFYLNACLNSGFNVVKNSPWVIVADLGSPALILYHEKYNLSSINQIFSVNFSKTINSDIDYLRQSLFRGYNNLANNFKYEKDIKVCINNKLIINNINRSNINIIQYNNKFNILYWLEYYNNIRNLEESNPFSKSDVNKFSDNAKKLQKQFDKQRAIGYINEQYRSVYKSKTGGINFFIKRSIARKDNRATPTSNPKSNSSIPSGGTTNGGY